MVSSSCVNALLGLVILFQFLSTISAGGNKDIEKPANQSLPATCRNPFRDIMVKKWANGKEEDLFGLSASFGSRFPTSIDSAKRLPATYAEPPNGCAPSTTKLSGTIGLVLRGECEFIEKARIAQAGGATAIVVINTEEGSLNMSCSSDNNITIPVMLIDKSGAESIHKSFASGQKVELLLYSPDRPILAFSVVFLWLMATGTVVCASFWSEITASASEPKIESYDEMSPKESRTAKDDEMEIVSLTAKSAIFFIITASTFLVLLYFFMSSWFVWILIIVFSIGGVQGMHNCIVSLIESKCKGCAYKTLMLPLVGKTSVLSLSVLLGCIAFAIFWIATRKESFSYFGQDVLGICLMITVLQLAQLPNIKVATILLCSAFLYDIFWVFISPLIFKTSVMIAVCLLSLF
ncbi:aspartic protease [Lithospermum erythrorhizon]|uniref:Aspartic protease n=1 Tax=Lithospermum erythrorhizon TaxID=34254 RepID=A0AAV3PHW5_LITER